MHFGRHNEEIFFQVRLKNNMELCSGSILSPCFRGNNYVAECSIATFAFSPRSKQIFLSFRIRQNEKCFREEKNDQNL
jgi:hypothetical protein